MDPNAFNALFNKHPAESTNHIRFRQKAGKRQRSTEHTTAARGSDSGSHFAECPLCGKSVHAPRANAHVERCFLDDRHRTKSTGAVSKSELSHAERRLRTKAADQSACSKQEILKCDDGIGAVDRSAVVVVSHVLGGESGERSSSEAPVTGFEEGKGEPFSSSPNPRRGDGRIVDKSGGSVDLTSSAAGCQGVSAAEGAVTSQLRGAFPQPAKTTQTRKRDVTPNMQKDNVFSQLMAASALSNFKEEMYIWRNADGTLSWGWGPAGRPRPAPPKADSSTRWSCQVATKGPDGRKAGMCELWTNLPPVALDVGRQAAVDVQGGANPRAVLGLGGSDNAGVKGAFPGASLSRLSVPVLKSMLQKNVRRGRPESAVRCALELSLRSWNDAIRRVLVIVVEDSLLHPAAPFLAWLMAATSKGYRPPPCLIDAFLCTVYETAKCSVRDSTDSCRTPPASTAEAVKFMDDKFSAPHPRDLVASGTTGNTGKTSPRSETSSAVADASHDGRADTAAGRADEEFADIAGNNADDAISFCRRALLMRMAYGGLTFDQALMKASCLSWGERIGCFSSLAEEKTRGEASVAQSTDPSIRHTSRLPPAPPELTIQSSASGDVTPFDYVNSAVISAFKGNLWGRFMVESYTGCGMPKALRSQLLGYVRGGGNSAAIDTNPCKAYQTVDVMVKRVVGHPGTAPARLGVGSKDGAGVATQRPKFGGPIVREADAIVSGVDFHCSNVLDELLRSGEIHRKVLQALHSGVERGHGDAAVSQLSGEVESSQRDIHEAVKRAMWSCSSGLNARGLQLAFTWEAEDCGGLSQCHASLRQTKGATWSDLGVDTRVWAAISNEVAGWTRKFVRGKLAQGALGRG